MTSADFNLGLGAGLAIAGVLYLALWWWARHTTLDSVDPPAPSGVPTGSDADRNESEPDPRGSTPNAAGAVSPRATPPPERARLEPGLPALPRTPVVERAADLTFPSNGHSSTAGVVRLSQRVILHVYAQGALPAGAIAPATLCQAGIGEALGVTQGGLAAALRRLEAAGVLTAERGHVHGQDRRLKIYRLSSRGLELAQEIRARNGPRTAAPRASAPTADEPSRRS